MSESSRFGDAITGAAARWDELAQQALNAPQAEPAFLDRQEFPITVAEVLEVSVSYFGANAVIVRDTEGKVWVLPECVGEENGLGSRHDVAPGMRFVVRLERFTEQKTTVLVVGDAAS